MAELATLVLLNELMDSDDEKPTREKLEIGLKEDVIRDISLILYNS